MSLMHMIGMTDCDAEPLRGALRSADRTELDRPSAISASTRTIRSGTRTCPDIMGYGIYIA